MFKFITTAILIISITISSCKKDFLDVSPQGSLTEALFPQTEADAFLAINAVYGSLHNWSYWSGGFPILDIMSDDARKGSNPGDAGRLNLVDNFTFTPTLTDIFPWYSALYQSVKSANVVIERIPPIEMDETLKTRYIAEAKFLRAMFYFNLVRAWGDVPKVTTVVADPDLPRSPKMEIYNEIIIPDLLEAINNLPEKNDYNSDDLGRATKGAAKTLLAKVYLYLKDYENASLYALEVINSAQYILESDFSNAFSLTGQFGIESIFEVGARPFEEGPLLGGNQFANTQGVRGVPNKGWGFNRPSLSLINSFAADDIRKDATIIFLGETIDGVFIQGDVATNDITYTDDSETDTLEIECYNQKVWVPGETTVSEWGYNIRVLRYAEVLLIAAEALNENGNSGDALFYLNQIRTRAGLIDFTEAEQTLLRNEIIDQRRFEFAMEGERFYDLVRTGKAPEILGPLGFIEGKNELFPIPQSEIDLSGGAITQNPGW
ncbi:MAG: RagB/SusD family nutrient uptake outer membrane protein [Fimbriimonadaceae bacterium]|nr:RagB/SusD family nutrient uptake outer membrane protein [Chitinophagales bacterium]